MSKKNKNASQVAAVASTVAATHSSDLYHVLDGAMERAVTDATLRSQVQDVLTGLTAGPAGAISIQQGSDTRVIVHIGSVPVGTDKVIRGILNPDGGKSYKVSSIRDLPLQERSWKMATVETPNVRVVAPKKTETAMETPVTEPVLETVMA